MSVTLPLRGDLPDYSLQVELEGKTYGFRVQWNFRDSAWYLSISDSLGAALADGIRLVVDFPVFARFRDARLPPGLFQAMDTAGDHREVAAMTDLGKRVVLLYFAAGELPAP